MSKRTKLFGTLAILLLVLGGFAVRAPWMSRAGAEVPSPTHQQLARVDVPTDRLVQPDVGTPPLGPVAEATPAPNASPTPYKHHHNGDPEPEVKRDYKEFLAHPDTLGFKPSEYYFRNVCYHIRQSFVEPPSDEQMIAGVKKEVANLLEQAKVPTDKLKGLGAGMKVDDILPPLIQAYGDKVNKDLLTYAAILGMLEGLKDNYSVLMRPEEYEKLQEQMQSTTFGGIGIYIELDKDHGNALTIFEPIEGSPAAKAGLEAGDKIVKIDGKSTDKITLDMAQAAIRGQVGTPVLLTIDRKGQLKDVSVTRDNIHVVSVSEKMLPDHIGYIRLRMFGAKTPQELDEALTKVKGQGAKAIILDLRNNGGGYIDAAVDVVGEFAPPGSLVVYTLNRDGRRHDYKSTATGSLNVPMVVMINEFSASASEITAGALRDHKLCTLVGDHSFGKGSVQQLYPFQDNSALKLTIARFYSPNGSVIDRKGIDPNVEVDMEPRFVGKMDQDIQLKKAIQVLESKVGATQ